MHPSSMEFDLDELAIPSLPRDETIRSHANYGDALRASWNANIAANVEIICRKLEQEDTEGILARAEHGDDGGRLQERDSKPWQ